MPDVITRCPFCKQPVASEFFYCPYCGKGLNTKSLSTSALSQAWIYLLSIFLPPLGLWPGIKYIRSQERKAKTIGEIAIVLTVIFTILTFWYSYGLVGQLMRSLSGIGSF